MFTYTRFSLYNLIQRAAWHCKSRCGSGEMYTICHNLGYTPGIEYVQIYHWYQHGIAFAELIPVIVSFRHNSRQHLNLDYGLYQLVHGEFLQHNKHSGWFTIYGSVHWSGTQPCMRGWTAGSEHTSTWLFTFAFGYEVNQWCCHWLFSRLMLLRHELVVRDCFEDV